MDYCLNCGGMIPEPNRAYGYAGKICYCPKNPAHQYQRPASKEKASWSGGTGELQAFPDPPPSVPEAPSGGEDAEEMARIAEGIDRGQAESVSAQMYLSAVRGRSDFRNAYREARAEIERLRTELSQATDKMNALAGELALASADKEMLARALQGECDVSASLAKERDDLLDAMQTISLLDSRVNITAALAHAKEIALSFFKEIRSGNAALSPVAEEQGGENVERK